MLLSRKRTHETKKNLRSIDLSGQFSMPRLNALSLRIMSNSAEILVTLVNYSEVPPKNPNVEHDCRLAYGMLMKQGAQPHWCPTPFCYQILRNPVRTFLSPTITIPHIVCVALRHRVCNAETGCRSGLAAKHTHPPPCRASGGKPFAQTHFLPAAAICLLVQILWEEAKHVVVHVFLCGGHEVAIRLPWYETMGWMLPDGSLT